MIGNFRLAPDPCRSYLVDRPPSLRQKTVAKLSGVSIGRVSRPQYERDTGCTQSRIPTTLNNRLLGVLLAPHHDQAQQRDRQHRADDANH